MNEIVTPGEPLKEIFVLDIIHRDMKVMIAAYKWGILFDVPVEDRNDVCDIAVFQRLSAS